MNMKRILYLFILIIPCFLFAKHATIQVTFMNGDRIDYTAKSYYTNYNRHDGYWEYFQHDHFGFPNNRWICICDYVQMNPASRETKKNDFRALRNRTEELGHTVHYFDMQGYTEDQYGVSFLTEEIDKITIDNG